MFTLAPGPSYISDAVKADMCRAAEDNIGSISHRSSQFTDLSKKCITELRKLINVPDDYHLFYFDSATHVWHSIAANVIEQHSFHFVNGSFSEKMREAATSLGKKVYVSEAPWGAPCAIRSSVIPPESELITLCYNETSTGVSVTAEEVKFLRETHPEKLIAIDLTSCAGGIHIPLALADIAYFSVQKCLGLPPGLAIAVVSPRALEKSKAMRARGTNLAGMWAWEHLHEWVHERYQTPHTPNITAIYLLAEQCARKNANGGLDTLAQETQLKKEFFDTWLGSQHVLTHFVSDTTHRSSTVFVLNADSDLQKRLVQACAEKEITFGTGYGKIKDTTFRVANFPAVTEDMLRETLRVFDDVLSA